MWVFGESFGGIFAPGLTWLFGAPGAALVYVAAGALIALPEHAWRTPRLGRQILAGLGLFLAGMAVLQAWPGRGFWQGISHGQPGTLAAMGRSMAQVPQPGFLSSWVNAFAAFDEAHGFAVNLFAVAALAVTGAVFLTGRPRLIRPVLAAGGYLALTRVPAPAGEQAASAAGSGWRELAGPAALRQRAASAGIRSVAAAGAVGVIILGAAPMAVAQASPNADPILAESITGSSAPLNYPAAGFSLTDQYGRAVTLASLRGKAVLLTGLDPVCTSDCPLIGQEFRQAGQLLGAQARQVALVAIVLNPNYRSLSVVRAFDLQEGLNRVPDWLYLTGSLAELQRVWQAYGLTAQDLPAGAMVLHNEQAYVIDPAGRVREEFGTDPGPGTAATQSSFAVMLADAARQALGSS